MALILLLFCALPVAFSSTVAHRVIQHRVGQILALPTGEHHNGASYVDEAMLPGWCRFNATIRLIICIPQLADLGQSVIFIRDSPIEVSVGEEPRGICGEESTYWVEIFNDRRLEELSITKQFERVRAQMKHLSGGGSSAPETTALTDWRVFPAEYLDRFRTVAETHVELEGYAPKPDQMVLVLNISCGELSESASDVINALAESGQHFRVVEGTINVKRTPLLVPGITTETVTPSGDEHTRTTRRIHSNGLIDQRPIVTNQIKTFTCQRGILCRIPLAPNTFHDDEDGETANLALSVHVLSVETPLAKNESIDESTARNWLVPMQGLNRMEGVPLETVPGRAIVNGDVFGFRLEGQDRAGQVASTPFQVIVQDGPVSNHEYVLLLDTPLERFQTRPAEWLRELIYTLGRALKVSEESMLETIRIDSVGGHKLPGKDGSAESGEIDDRLTEVRWTNQSLLLAAGRHCREAEINATRDKMLHTRNDRVRHDFNRLMGPHYLTKKVTLELRGGCNLKAILGDKFRIWATTTERNIIDDDGEHRSLPAALWHFVERNMLAVASGILLLVILLLVFVLLLLCWLSRRRDRRRFGYNQYTTKGHPIVFPEEIPHGANGSDDDSGSGNGSMATVTTPMLLEREQPPMEPKLTLHENPLYRPPPQVQATLMKTSPTNSAGGGESNGTGAPTKGPTATSTFTSPYSAPLKSIDASPTPIRANGNGNGNGHLPPYYYQQSTMGASGLSGRGAGAPFAPTSSPPQQISRRTISANAVGQRRPPPYIATAD